MADKTFPSSTLFHYPILLTLADGNMHTTNELIAIEIEKLSISESDQQVVTPGKNGKAGTGHGDRHLTQPRSIACPHDYQSIALTMGKLLADENLGLSPDGLPF